MKQFLFFSYSFLILATAVFLIAFAMYAWRNRERMVVLGFIIWMLSITGWLVTHFSMLVTDSPGFLLWALKIEFFFQVFIPPAFLLFSIQFTGHNRWYYSWRPLFLFVAPVTLFLLSTIEQSNTWLWTNLQID